MRGETYSIALTVAGGVGAAQNVEDLTDMWLQLATVSGSPTGTIQIEGSIDGEHFFNVGTALTASGTLEVSPKKLKRLRANVTGAISGGVWALTLGAFNARSAE